MGLILNSGLQNLYSERRKVKAATCPCQYGAKSRKISDIYKKKSADYSNLMHKSTTFLPNGNAKRKKGGKDVALLKKRLYLCSKFVTNRTKQIKQ